jgi:hypothetical protein
VVRWLGWAWKGGHAACRGCIETARVPEFWEGSGFRVTVYEVPTPNYTAACFACGATVTGENCSTTNIEKEIEMTDSIQLARDALSGVPPVTEDWVNELKNSTIQNDEQQQFVATLLRAVKDRWQFVEDKRKSITKPLNDAFKATNAVFKPALEGYKEVEDILKQKLAEYLELKQATNVASLQAASQAATPTQAAALMTSVAPVAPPPGVSMRYVWKFEVTEPDAVPRELCSPDLKKIEAALAAGMTVPGVRTFQESIVSSRR